MDCALPDMDDLLDQLEASVAASEGAPSSHRPTASAAIPRGRRSPSPSTCSSVSGAESDDERIHQIHASSNGLGTPKAEILEPARVRAALDRSIPSTPAVEDRKAPPKQVARQKSTSVSSVESHGIQNDPRTEENCPQRPDEAEEAFEDVGNHLHALDPDIPPSIECCEVENGEIASEESKSDSKSVDQVLEASEEEQMTSEASVAHDQSISKDVKTEIEGKEEANIEESSEGALIVEIGPEDAPAVEEDLEIQQGQSEASAEPIPSVCEPNNEPENVDEVIGSSFKSENTLEDLEVQPETVNRSPERPESPKIDEEITDEHSSSGEDQKVEKPDEMDDLERYLAENPCLDASEQLGKRLDSAEVTTEETEPELSVSEPAGEDPVEKEEELEESIEEAVADIVESENVDLQTEDYVKDEDKVLETVEVEEAKNADDSKSSEEVADTEDVSEQGNEDAPAVEAPEDVEEQAEVVNSDAEQSQSAAPEEFTEPEVAEVVVQDEEQIENAHIPAEDQDPEDQDSEMRRSVIASTHDISVETEGRLTESELLLGKVKPYWIPDEECSHCMLCESKFNVLNRRHHCRACGRVLCGKCCNNRRILAYMPDPNVKHRVCEPCVKTLEKIELYEAENGANEANGVNEEENDTAAEGAPEPSGVSTEAEQTPRTTKSALKVRRPANPEDPCSSAAVEQLVDVTTRVPKRSVTFLDGVNPGDGGEELPPAEVVARAASASANKPKKKSARRALSSHRMREMRIEEEPICLFTGGSTVFVPKDDGTLEMTDVSALEDELASGLPVVVALKRNLHVVVQLCELRCCNQGRVMCVSSRGLYGIGADEVVFVCEHPEGAAVKLPEDVLRKVDEIYMTCLDPLNATADEKVGIRMVRERMLKLYRVDSGKMDGFDVTRILLFRPTHQCLEHLPLPSTPFYFACYIKRSEVIWSLAMPKRVLHKIGFHSSCFPAAIVNKWNREDVYVDQDHESSVLKVFTDFRNFSYRLTSVPGSTISLADGVANIEIPTWAAEKLFSVINANRNMVAWVADIHPDADSILVCDQELHSFKTTIFAKVADQRNVTGCSFVIFDGALKSNTESMSVSIVEDGIVIRLRSTVMGDLVEKLLAGSDFEVSSNAMKLSIRWVKSAVSDESPFTIRSPIDGFVLEEQWQYGALLTRQLRSLMPLQSATEWSLRLASVINIFEDKFPTTFQSKIFSICEEVAKLVATSLSPFISILVENNVRTIVMRIQLSQESAEYQTALWPGLDDIHAVWIVTLDDQVAPILFNICSHVTSPFCAELHMPILSSRPLPEVPNGE